MLSGWPACNACLGGSEDMVLVSIPNFLGQPYVREAFLVIGVVSMYGALNSNLTAAIRTSFSMARDGLLPRAFARIGGREVPPAAVALTFVGSGVLVFLTIETIAILASLAFLGLFAFVHASVIALRRRERRSGPGFRVPLVPAVPMFAIALNLAVGAVLWNFPARQDTPIAPGVFAFFLGVAWLAVGLSYHWFAGGRGARGRSSNGSAIEVRDILTTAEDRVELERYRVFLPLREFEDENLVELGARIENAPCDVIVFKTQGLRKPLKRIVVLTSPIWSLEGIDDLALMLAEEDHAVVEVVSLASDPTEAERLKQESSRFEGRAHERGVTVQPKVVYSSQWESEALRESVDASLLMIRATSPGGLRKFALSPVEDRIVKLAKCPVLILRKWA